MEERFGQSYLSPVAHRPAYHPAKNVPPSLIGRKNAITNEERNGAAVVSNDAERNIINRVVAVVASEQAEAALARWQALPDGRAASRIGIVDETLSRVVLATAIGGERFLEELEDDPLPRIC